MARFYDLSDDLLLTIVEQIDTGLSGNFRDPPKGFGIAAVLHLALCSKRLHRIAEPVLYRRFPGRNESWPFGNESCPTRNRLVLFGCRIAARPDLANRVRCIADTAHRSDVKNPKILDVSAVRKENWSQIQDSACSASEHKSEGMLLVLDLMAGSWDAWMTFLMLSTPNLEEVTLHVWVSEANLAYPRLTGLFETAAQLQQRDRKLPLALSRLAKVSIFSCGRQDGMHPEDLDMFLKIKSIKSVVASMAAFEDWEYVDGAVSQSVETVQTQHNYTTQHLEIYNGNIPPLYLVNYLRRFSCLKSLDFVNGASGYEPFEPPRIMAGLEHLKPTLGRLSFEDRSGDIGGLSNYSLGDLSWFKKLRYIEMDSDMLVGTPDSAVDEEDTDFKSEQNLVDSLPSSLEHLHIRDTYNDLLGDAILELLSQKEVRFPVFKRLDLRWSRIGGRLKQKRIGRFREFYSSMLMNACERAGVDMVILTASPSPKFVFFDRSDKSASQVFLYPYIGYEEFCEKHGCDPATGKHPLRSRVLYRT